VSYHFSGHQSALSFLSSRPADLLHHHGKTQVRAGIQSIEPRQRDAAAAIGMTPQQTLQRVVMPQAIRRVLPAWNSFSKGQNALKHF